ncbi:DNA/RNA nuclease SfsA [Bacillus sp. lyk4-R2A-2]|uniref:DNA/RNA nuclease SfsA n=1 Tax=Bacillus sp. lyk4-R2A-2 TaxID=3040282 RepID=UPI00254CF49D|nr:DNA/RNA nuclease SfsA [Bacillus sp. lyk4-R2A-2]
MYLETIRGIFVSEYKNRFLCNVLIDNEMVECYVPSSSRIQNYLDLKDCEVLLTKNKSSKSRTSLSLFAVNIQQSFVILNLNKVNSIIEELINRREIYKDNIFNVCREKVLENKYKSDLYLVDTEGNTEIIIEAKGIISDQRDVYFPQVNSERSLEQLIKINELLLDGKKVHYYFVSLSPFTKKIHLKEDSDYTMLLKKCIVHGLEIKPLRILYDGRSIQHDEEIKIAY